MEAINYLLKRTTINSIKELRKHPIKLILYILIIGFIIFSLVVNRGKTNDISLNSNIEIFNTIFLSAIFFLVFTAIKNGTENGNSLFMMSDVNLLFPAPIKPQQVLVYGFIRQIFISFGFALIVAFQIPNLHLHFPLHSYGGILILGNTILLNFFCGILSIFIYAIGSLNEKNSRIIKNIMYALLAFLGLGAIYYVIKSQDMILGIFKYLNLPLFKYIPVIGWSLNIFGSAIYGVNPMTIVYTLLIVFTSAILILIIYRLNLDYYEDALESSINKESQLAAAKEGKVQYKGKIRKTKDEIKYSGAAAILSRQILEFKKTGFLFLDMNTIIMNAVAIGYAYFSKKGGMMQLLYMLTYMNLIFLASTGWNMELKNHYIFLIPESSSKKVFYASAMEIFKSFVNGLIVFTISTILFKENIILGIIMAFTYTSFTSLILYSDLVTRRLLSGQGNLLISRFLRMIITILFVIPGIVLSFVFNAFGSKVNIYLGNYGEYFIIIVYNILVCALFAFLSRGIFEKIEME